MQPRTTLERHIGRRAETRSSTGRQIPQVPSLLLPIGQSMLLYATLSAARLLLNIQKGDDHVQKKHQIKQV